MSLWKVLVLFLPIVGLCAGNFVEFVELIDKIQQEANLKTLLCFSEIHEDVLLKNLHLNSKMAVLFFSSFEYHAQEVSLHKSLLLVRGRSEQSDYDEQFKILQLLIESMPTRGFVIIYGIHIDSLQEYFEFFDSWKFARIFGVAENNVSHAFLPYADADSNIQRISKHSALPNSLSNLNGYAFRTTITTDMPRSFRFVNSQGVEQFLGFSPEIILAFLRRFNATYKEIHITRINGSYYPAIVNATLNQTIDISMNVFPPTDKLAHSTVKHSTWALLVAHSGYIDTDEYFERPFSPTVWMMVGLTGAFVALADFAVKKLVDSRTDFWMSFSETFLTLIGKSSEEPSTMAKRIKIQLLLFSFILGNLYLIHFTSFVTVFIKRTHLSSIQDLIDHNMTVKITNTGWKYINYMNACPPGLEKIIQVIKFSTYVEGIIAMNDTKAAYSSSEDRIRFLFEVQKHFGESKFYSIPFPDIKFDIGFLLHCHCPFKENLDHLILQVREAGLIRKWDLDASLHFMETAQKWGLTFLDMRPCPVNLHEMNFAWNLLMKGLILACLVFAGEVLVSGVKMGMKLVFGLYNKLMVKK